MTSGTDPLLTEKEVSVWIKVSTPNLQRMRSNGTGPRYVQLSPRRIGYRKSDVETWLSSRTTDRIGALAPAVGVGMSDESLSCIAPNFENVPTKRQRI
jgi:predicted DNA-binding transcriptional regulator AlpA